MCGSQRRSCASRRAAALYAGRAINAQFAGVSTAYGPVAVAVTGTTTAPQIRIRATRPGFGLGLTNVDAQIRATARGYEIRATGQSQYGPFVADVLVETGRGPMAIQIRRLTIAGFTFTGRVVQTAAGPYAGMLSVSGQGLNGTVRLAAAGKVQRADISANANGATIPGNPPITIQRGIIQATAILYPTAPSIVGDVQIAGLRRGDLLVQTARARINYQGGRGRRRCLLKGRAAYPSASHPTSALTPDHIRAAAQGTVNRIDFRLARPADIRKAGNDWVLAPTTIVLPQGNVRLAGRYGNGLIVQSRIDGLDLSIFNVFSPGLGLGDAQRAASTSRSRTEPPSLAPMRGSTSPISRAPASQPFPTR
jgi:translocation and assembly module TamB